MRLIVEDDGHGFSCDGGEGDGAMAGRLGLLGMRERLSLVGGTLEVESGLGRGTTLFGRVPLPPPGGTPPGDGSPEAGEGRAAAPDLR